MKLSQISRFFNTNNDIVNLFRISLLIWILCAIYLVFIKYDPVYHLALNDTDDFMRYHQYTQWIKNRNWYLQPLAQFNPEDGQIMHWSRLADIPLASVALLAHIFVDWHMAFTIANIIVPLIYLLIFIFLISLITYRLFDMEVAKIAMLMPLLSPFSSRFIPGALDHHNLQFILLAIFILYLPLINFNKLKKKAFFSALAMSCSLWVGLENIYTFVTILFLLTVLGVYKDSVYLDFCEIFCLYSIILITILLVANRPIIEFFNAYYDALSFPFLLCFISAYVFCKVLIIIINKHLTHKVAIYLILGVALYLPIVSFYPELVLGGYSNYPTLLKENWLNNVTEATPIIKYIPTKFEYVAYIFAVLPAILSPLFFKDKVNVGKYWILYSAFWINYLLAFFWQIRMFQTALVCCIPLQAYVCLALREKYRLAISKLVILTLSFPTIILVIGSTIFYRPEENKLEIIYDNKYNSYYVSASDLLKKNEVSGSNILTTISLGAVVILSDNNIISAPYHRNIRGNEESIRFFLTKNNDEAKQILDRNNIDYILVDPYFINSLNINSNRNETTIDKLTNNKDLPEWLKFIDSSSQVKLYQYIKE